jgi:putative endonuclease
MTVEEGKVFLFRNRLTGARRRVILNMLSSAYVYILTNTSNDVYYIGVTTDLKTRMWEHCTKQNPHCFTARYNLNKLIYFQGFETIMAAVEFEKFLKGKKRGWKIAFLKKSNPDFKDLGDLLPPF